MRVQGKTKCFSARRRTDIHHFYITPEKQRGGPNLNSKRLFRGLTILVLAILVPFLSVPLAHATGITFKSFCDAGTVSGTTINCVLSGVSASDTIIVSIFGVGVFNGFTVSDSQTNTYTQKISSITGNGGGVSTYIFATLATASPGSIVVTVATGGATRIYTFTASDYSGVTGFGQIAADQQDSAGNSGTSTITLSGTGATSAFIDDFSLAGSVITVTPNNAQSIRDSPANGGNAPCNGACRAADTTSPIMGWSWSGGSGCGCFVSHSVLELTSSALAPTNTVFQCYGNCGSPPITLVNTNSTHTVNFNQSIALLYEFQSNLNGFLLNVTTSLAKSYTNGQILRLGIYTISSCTQGQVPFSPICPGLLTAAGTTGNLVKGKNSLSGVRIPVSTGQWIGITVSAVFSGLDLNDTNTGLQLFQTNEGSIPTTIQAPIGIGSSKMGLWAWITGNVVVGTGPPQPSTGVCSNFGFLDCFFTNLINSFCSQVTTACQTSSAIFWAIIFTIIAMFILGYGEARLFGPNHKFSFVSGELGFTFFLGFILFFAGLSLVTTFVVVFFIMVLTLAFSKNVGKFF